VPRNARGAANREQDIRLVASTMKKIFSGAQPHCPAALQPLRRARDRQSPNNLRARQLSRRRSLPSPRRCGGLLRLHLEGNHARDNIRFEKSTNVLSFHFSLIILHNLTSAD